MGHSVLLRWAAWCNKCWLLSFSLSCFTLVMKTRRLREGNWPGQSHTGSWAKSESETQCALSSTYIRGWKHRRLWYLYAYFSNFFSSVSFFPCYLLTQISQLLTQTILEIRRHSFNANNAFLKEVVSTHNIFMLSDLMPTIYIHGWMGISGSINVICIFIYIRTPDFQI